MLGAAAAVSLSGVPFDGPVAAARVGYRDGQYLLNPTVSELSRSDLNLVVAGTRSSVLMVESEAWELSEEEMLGGGAVRTRAVRGRAGSDRCAGGGSGRAGLGLAALRSRRKAWRNARANIP